MREFEWRPLVDAPEKTDFNTVSVAMGDGYQQETALGINNTRRGYSLSFIGNAERITAIHDFIIEHQGFKRFTWRTPDNKLLKFVALDVSRSYVTNKIGGDGLHRLTTKFEERF